MNPDRTRKYSVTIPEDLAERVRRRTGSGGFSAYVTAAIQRQFERDNLAEIIASYEEENGPLPRESVEAARARLRGDDGADGQAGAWHAA
jgi:hypothetical protein